MKTKIFFYLFSYVWQQITDRNFNLFQVSGSVNVSFSSLFNQTIYVKWSAQLFGNERVLTRLAFMTASLPRFPELIKLNDLKQ